MSMSNKAILLAKEKGYHINKDGTVISPKGNLLKLVRQQNGYLVFAIRNGKKTSTIFVHRYQAYEKFGDKLFKSECVRHLDGDRSNNSYENIQIGTFYENDKDKPIELRKKFALAGAKTRRKLSDENVNDIKGRLLLGESLSKIAKSYSVARTTIQQIKDGKTYNEENRLSR